MVEKISLIEPTSPKNSKILFIDASPLIPNNSEGEIDFDKPLNSKYIISDKINKNENGEEDDTNDNTKRFEMNIDNKEFEELFKELDQNGMILFVWNINNISEILNKNFILSENVKKNLEYLVKNECNEVKDLQNKLNNDFIDKKRYREIKHDKYYDNIIFKKIKTVFINEIIIFINTVIEVCLNEEKGDDSMNKNIIKDLDYESIKATLNKKKNMEILYRTIKELMSKDISPKYKTLEKDYNKKIIDELLNNKSNDCNTEILVYVFNLKVIKWLNIFLGKTELNWNLFGEKKVELKKKIRRIDKYLKEEFEDKEDKILLGKHLIIMYNIGKYLDNKKERNRKKIKK